MGRAEYNVLPLSQIGLRLAAVDDDRGAAHPARTWRGEERNDIADFLGAPEATERQLALHELGNTLGIRFLTAMPRTAGKEDRAGRNTDRPYVVGRELLRKRLR